MYKYLLILISFFSIANLSAQHNSLKGTVLDEHGSPVLYATAALLNTSDSTLLNFAISNEAGNYEIRNTPEGKYILQISYVGYQIFDTLVTLPAKINDIPIFILRPKSELLNTVEINGERTPLQIKGDTIEYNAGSFKTQPDASAEDLLRKLPGMQVDQNGNIKAQGEDVQQVLVDGKEFFSSDPTVATKNLPADAIDKVQVFDKTSDEADFTGVDDGSRSKTINLLLKEDKKSMWMGDAQAGYGSDSRYQAAVKSYRFTKASQFAALGMLNNINQYGFSINDYIDFNGGIGNLMHGGGFKLGGDDQMPLDYGQQVNGLITSGAGGLNYTHEAVPGNRFNISYLGNGFHKNIFQDIHTENFIDSASFITDENSNEFTKNYYHRLNINFRNKPDSMQSVFGTAAASLNYGNRNSDNDIRTYSSDSLINDLSSTTFEMNNNLQADADVNYIRKTGSAWKYIKAGASFNIKRTLTDAQWNNLTNYYSTDEIIADDAYQNDQNYQTGISGSFSASRKLEHGLYLEPSFALSQTNEKLNRQQGDLYDDITPIDSLSPDFARQIFYVKPGLALKKNTKKTQWKATLAAEQGWMQNTLNDTAAGAMSFFYALPQFSFEKDIREGRHLRIAYESDVNTPTAVQLMPVTDNINPLVLFKGNSELRPEYAHSAFFNWVLFDQFSFTSLFTHARITYTKDKINYATTINSDLSQSLTPVNVPEAYRASAGFSFSTPLRPLRLNITLDADESYNRGINYVNTEENIINAFTHNATLRFDNRKKEKLDVRAGVTLNFTQTNYSLALSQSGNYFTNSLFTELQYTPTDKWRFSFNADLSKYSVEGFDESTVIPLLQAQLNRYLLKSNRGTISLKAYDILNRSTGITQTGAYNYLQSVEANTIGRYFMLSFKYRINKTAQDDNIELKVN